MGTIAGPQGIQGIQGERGDAGPPGADGVDGADGEAARISVGTVTELEYGQPPTVENVGTTSDAVLNFGIPGPPPPTIRIYKANLSTAGSDPLLIPLGGVLNYDLRYRSAGDLQLFFHPLAAYTQVVCDYRIVSQYNATSGLITNFNAMEGNAVAFTSSSAAVDTDIYSNTQEMHKTWIRVQHPTTALWSTYDISLFSSQNAARLIVWVTVIEENGSY